MASPTSYCSSSSKAAVPERAFNRTSPSRRRRPSSERISSRSSTSRNRQVRIRTSSNSKFPQIHGNFVQRQDMGLWTGRNRRFWHRGRRAISSAGGGCMSSTGSVRIAPGECSGWGARLTDGHCPAGSRWATMRSSRRPAGLRRCMVVRAAPDPRILTGWSGASPHVLRFPPRAFLRFPVCPPGPPPSPAFLWFPFVRRSPVRPLRPLPGSGSPSVSLRVPFP